MRKKGDPLDQRADLICIDGICPLHVRTDTAEALCRLIDAA